MDTVSLQGPLEQKCVTQLDRVNIRQGNTSQISHAIGE
jgi:hypothetical protein